MYYVPSELIKITTGSMFVKAHSHNVTSSTEKDVHFSKGLGLWGGGGGEFLHILNQELKVCENCTFQT